MFSLFKFLSRKNIPIWKHQINYLYDLACAEPYKYEDSVSIDAVKKTEILCHTLEKIGLKFELKLICNMYLKILIQQDAGNVEIDLSNPNHIGFFIK